MLVAYVGCGEILVVNKENEGSFLHDNFHWYQMGEDIHCYHGIGLKHFQDYVRKECEGNYMAINTSPTIS